MVILDERTPFLKVPWNWLDILFTITIKDCMVLRLTIAWLFHPYLFDYKELCGRHYYIFQFFSTIFLAGLARMFHCQFKSQTGRHGMKKPVTKLFSLLDRQMIQQWKQFSPLVFLVTIPPTNHRRNQNTYACLWDA